MPSLGSPGAASNGSVIFVPWVMKEARVEEVAIVQRDGHKAVYWPPPPPLTPTLVNVIPIYLEVENRTTRNVTGVTVDFRAFDSSGTLIPQAVSQVATLVEALRPGQRSPVVFTIPFPGDYSAFQAASKSFTLLPDWRYTEADPQAGLAVGLGYYPYRPYPPTPTPAVPTPTLATPTPTPSLRPPNIYGWVKNNTGSTVTGASVVVVLRGNEKAYNLVLDAKRILLYSIPPGGWFNFYTTFDHDYGPLFGNVEAVAQRRLDIPGILEVSSW